MRIHVNGAKLDFGVYGAADGPWVTLCHSLAASREMWAPQMHCLASRYRILAFDLRGHGASEMAETEELTPFDLAHDVVRLLNVLEIDSTHFVGCSIGGMIGLGLVLHFPTRVRSLVASNCRADVPPQNAAVWRERISLVRKTGIESIVEPTFERWFSRGFASRHPETAAGIRSMIRNTSVAGYTSCVHALLQVNYRHRLPEIAAPTMFIAGAQDLAAPALEMRDLHAAVAGSRYVELDPAGHLSNIDNARDYNQVLDEFLKMH